MQEENSSSDEVEDSSCGGFVIAVGKFEPEEGEGLELKLGPVYMVGGCPG